MRHSAPITAACCLVGLWASAACDQRFPWEVASGTPAQPPSSVTSGEAQGGGPPIAPDSPASGLFARCAEGLSLGEDPVRDVTRLGLSCGPVTGMTRQSGVVQEGVVAAGGASVKVDFELTAGTCYRIFAVAGPGVEDLALEVRSAQETVIASDHQLGRVALVQPDRPFCALSSEMGALWVRAEAGRGPFALEVWTLR